MAVTPIESRAAMSDAEWRTRCDLAALYHALHHLRMTDLVYTHLSARVPGEDGAFLINRYGEMFDEVTASSLLKMDMDGNVLGEAGRFNNAGFVIHSGVYLARADVACVMHTHTKAGVAVSADRRGLLPISQHSLSVIYETGYLDYGGVGGQEEREKFGAACARSNCVVLRNHGLLTLGETIPAAFKRMYYLELTCQIQSAAIASGEHLQMIDPSVQRSTEAYLRDVRAPVDGGEMEWESVLRMLDRRGADYRR